MIVQSSYSTRGKEQEKHTIQDANPRSVEQQCNLNLFQFLDILLHLLS
jgi:hypothetical protein